MLPRAARWACVCLGIVLSFGGCSMPGQRYLDAESQLDGRVVMQTGFGVPDGWSRQQAWNRLKNYSLASTSNPPPRPEKSSENLLEGQVRIALNHVGRAFAVVETESLRCVIDPSDPMRWIISSEDVMRLAKSIPP